MPICVKRFSTGDNYNIIYGEALPLRAMLILIYYVLFGPVYKTNPEDFPSVTTRNLLIKVQIFSLASKVIDNVLEDLKTGGAVIS